MMMVLTLVTISLVAVITVKYKNLTMAELESIWPFIMDEMDKIVLEDVNLLPSIGGRHDRYAYIDAQSAKKALQDHYLDTFLSMELPKIRRFMSWLRRLFIVAGTVGDDNAMNTLILDMKHKAAYLKRNEDEV